MMSVQIYKKILLFRVDFFRKMLTFRPSDIKMAKNIMDGPVLGCFASVFGTVRQEIAPKVVGRSVVALREGWHCVFLGGAPGVEISPLAPLGRDDREEPGRDDMEGSARHSRPDSLRHSRPASLRHSRPDRESFEMTSY